MRFSSIVLGGIALSLVMGISMVKTAGAQPAKDGASGTMTMNGKQAQFVHAYVDEQDPNEPIVLLSNKPIPPESIPFLDEQFVKAQKVYAVAFSVDKKGKKLSRTYGGIYYPGEEMHFAAIGEPNVSLTISRLDAGTMAGRIKTVKPVELDSLSYSFDLSFQVALGKPKSQPAPPELQVAGADVPAAKAYVEYCRALFAGDIEKMRSLLAAKSLKEFDSIKKEEREMALEFLKSRPSKLKLGKAAVTGDTASFTAEGVDEQGGKAAASIKMVLEKGAWKLLEDKWKVSY